MQPILVSQPPVPFADFRRYYLRHNARSLRRQALFFLIPFGIMIGLVIALGNIRYLSTPWFYGPPLLLIVGLIVAGILLYLSRVRQLHAVTGLTGPVEYRFTADGLTLQTTDGTGQLSWTEITGASVAGSGLLLTTDGALQPYVDLGAVQAPATAAALLQLLRAKGFAVAE